MLIQRITSTEILYIFQVGEDLPLHSGVHVLPYHYGHSGGQVQDDCVLPHVPGWSLSSLATTASHRHHQLCSGSNNLGKDSAPLSLHYPGEETILGDFGLRRVCFEFEVLPFVRIFVRIKDRIISLFFV